MRPLTTVDADARAAVDVGVGASDSARWSSAPTAATGRHTAARPTSIAIARAGLIALDDSGQWMLPISRLCRIVGVSERSLQIAFKEVFGVPPSVYVRRRALFRVHRVLELGDSGVTRVSKVALDHGFTHLSRFAQYYFEQFGEAPSETLRRGAPSSLAS